MTLSVKLETNEKQCSLSVTSVFHLNISNNLFLFDIKFHVSKSLTSNYTEQKKKVNTYFNQ